jgi:putative ABC transport system permease protein
MSTDVVPGQNGARSSSALPLVLRLALRDLRLGWSGFAIFVACITLGVAAIAGIGSLAGALETGLARQGQIILGGDVALGLVHRQANSEQRKYIGNLGAISEVATMRAMSRAKGGKRSALVRLKAVDKNYPLFGEVALTAAGAQLPVSSLDAKGVVAVESLLLERLDMKVGDILRIGSGSLKIIAELTHEPDQLAGRPTFGPRVLMSLETLNVTGLFQPGSLIRWRYRIALHDASKGNKAGLARITKDIERRFPDAGFTIRDRRNPSPSVRRVAVRLSQFLTLVGITTLMIGGIGVANAIASYLARKRPVIAAFKCLGASGGTIFRIYLTEVLALAGLGTLLGLGLGALLPLGVASLGAGALPVQLALEPQPFALILASAYGLLTALMFVFWPLGQARDLPAALLLRQQVSDEQSRPRKRYIMLSVLCGFMLAAIAIASAQSQLLAALACAGLVAVFCLFLGLGWLIERMARRLPRPRNVSLALARASLAGPGGLARPVALSLGASLTLLCAVALVNASLQKEFKTAIPSKAPSYFVLDVGKEQMSKLEKLVLRHEPETLIGSAPMLRGRIVKLNDKRPSEIKPAPGTGWVLNGDRGLSYSDKVPEGSELVKGKWWPKDYDGEPLVSFEGDIAKGLGLKMGDTVTVNVLGRNVTAKISNLRKVDWDSLAINFVMVFTPNTLAGAPHNILATLTLPEETRIAKEGAMIQEMTEILPNVTALRVRDAINSFRDIAEKVMAAIQSAGGVTLLAGAIVLAGALTTAHGRRTREAVIFKTLGATRKRIIIAHLIEYGALALVTGIFAASLGTLGAFLVVKFAMEASFIFSIPAILTAILLAVGMVLIFGTIATWQVLGAKSASHLRQR